MFIFNRGFYLLVCLLSLSLVSMATIIGDNITDRANVFKKTRKRIEEKFDCIIQKAAERRDALLEQLAEWEREDGAVVEGLKELKSSKQEMEQLYGTLKSEAARKSLKKSIDELSEQISESDNRYLDLSFVCETNDFEWRISQLGVLSKSKSKKKKKKKIIVRNYSSIQKPLLSFGKLGQTGRQFKHPSGILVDEDNSRIFVTDHNNRIQIWSMDGKYLSEFGNNTLDWPWEIVLHDKCLYVSDFYTHFITKWCCDTFSLIATSNTTPGSKQGQLCSPAGLDIDCGEVFILEHINKRVSVFNLDLRFKRIMAVGMLNDSYCLRIRSDTIYILELTGVMKLFSKTDQLLTTIDMSETLKYVFHFNFDSVHNFLITDMGRNTLSILSSNGELIHSVSFTTWGVSEPFGIDTTREGKLVVSFQLGNSALVIL